MTLYFPRFYIQTTLGLKILHQKAQEILHQKTLKVQCRVLHRGRFWERTLKQEIHTYILYTFVQWEFCCHRRNLDFPHMDFHLRTNLNNKLTFPCNACRAIPGKPLNLTSLQEITPPTTDKRFVVRPAFVFAKLIFMNSGNKMMIWFDIWIIIFPLLWLVNVLAVASAVYADHGIREEGVIEETGYRDA